MGRRKINRKSKLKIREEGGVNFDGDDDRGLRKRQRDRLGESLLSSFTSEKNGVAFLNEIIARDESTDDETEDPIIQPAPYIIVVHGPPKVGKSLLIKSLVKYYTKHDVADIAGPITIVAGEQRRIQFVECPNNVNGMIDAAKYADAVIFIIDVSFGYEMETLEFVNLLKVHGMPMVMGVFTHLDCFEGMDEVDYEMRAVHFKKDFRNEIYEGAQIFCMSAPGDETYPDHDICKLASFISGMEFHPLPWRASHPYVLVDRFKDVPKLRLRKNCDRKDIIFYGYLRGCDIKTGTKVHIAGVHDFSLAHITSLGETPPVRDIDGNDIEININEGSDLAEETQLKKEKIFRMGSYLKFAICNVPSKMVNNYDPSRPILIGGISPEEDIVGCISARFERHSLHMKSLKTKDPIIVSVGWRRYQTTPIYALEDLRKILEFTPEDEPCSAAFCGPFATPGTGVVAVQSLADSKAAFRILATGEVLGFSRDPYITVKTRVGTPCKVINKTALIKDMFASDIEINQYKDAPIKTVSGIQGEVNEAAAKEFLSKLKWKDGQPREGIAKCTFDRTICLSDTVYMETLYDVPTEFNPLLKTAKEPNRVWTYDTKESGKRGAHLVWASRERKVAPERVRVIMSKLQEEKLKFKSQRRKTKEKRRAVIIIHRLSNPGAAELDDAYVKQKEKDILNNIRRGKVSRTIREKKKKIALD
ncbi:hypothetical protein MKW92_000465 [Papaver armeniacum]|nr:hypothetical protein MKW92_000465 [Papaver armeniacum]